MILERTSIALLIYLLPVGWQHCVYAADGINRKCEQQLTAVLKWEILWHGTPASFRIPPHHSAHFALHRTRDRLSYCSQEVHACETYLRSETRNLRGVDSRECCGTQSETQALLEFVGQAAPASPRAEPSPVRGEISGRLAPNSGLLWLATIPVPDRDTIVGEYKKLRPADLETLEAHLRATMTARAGYEFITIPCYQPTDPEVIMYGERRQRGPIVFSLLWDMEFEKWVDAALLEGPLNREPIQEYRKVIESIPCATIHFK